jgi:glutaredoxin
MHSTAAMNDIGKRSKDLLGQLGKRLGKSAVDALNRADELGGDARDYLQEKLRDERVTALKERAAEQLARLGNLPGLSALRRDTAETAPAVFASEEARPAAAMADDAAPRDRTHSLGDPTIVAQIFGRDSCAWTGRALTLLDAMKVPFEYLDLDLPEHEALQPKLVLQTKQNTVPYVYLRGVFVGGYNALAEIQRLGQLEYALMSPEEKKTANPALRNIVIAARPNTDEVAPAVTDASTPEE